MHTTLKAVAAAAFAAAACQASAAPIAWNTWTSDSAGSITSGSDTVDVSFATQNAHQLVANYPSWGPSASFADGSTVNNGPVAANGIMHLIGGSTAVNTLTFSTAVTNPVVAIWSLGNPRLPATFVFDATPTLISGGTNAEYGGSPISVSGNTVQGAEGNGTVQFMGTFSSITWTNPIAENWYGFNVGIAGVAPAVPEPASLGLMAAGLAGLVAARRAKRKA